MMKVAGMGMGGGRGMGRGIGMGGGAMAVALMRASLPAGPLPPQTSGLFNRDQELQTLKTEAIEIADRLDSINTRIKEIEQDRQSSNLLAVVKSETCTGCGICERVCPNSAVVIIQRKTDRSQCNLDKYVSDFPIISRIEC
jgi:ferredoxin